MARFGRSDDKKARDRGAPGLRIPGESAISIIGPGMRVDGDLTTDDHDVALGEGFAGDAALRVHREAGVEDGIGDGVANFVWMAFADGLRREDVRA